MPKIIKDHPDFVRRRVKYVVKDIAGRVTNVIFPNGLQVGLPSPEFSSPIGAIWGVKFQPFPDKEYPPGVVDGETAKYKPTNWPTTGSLLYVSGTTLMYEGSPAAASGMVGVGTFKSLGSEEFTIEKGFQGLHYSPIVIQEGKVVTISSGSVLCIPPFGEF
jgi:hypothetical protein